MPWGRVDDTYYDHPKLEELQGEHPWPDRLAAAGLNSLAWSWCNRFLTDGRVPRGTVAKLGGTIELAELLVSVGLWEEAHGGFQIHDFLVYNDSRQQVMDRRATEAARKAAWRANRGPGGTDNGTSRSTEALVPPGVPPSVPAGQGDVSRRPSHGTRARGTRSANPDPTRPDPTRPTESPTRESARPRGRADVAALHDRGWKRVTAAQRAVLDEIAGRHESGHEFAATTIRNTPAGKDPLESVMAADRLWKDAQLRRADAEVAAWATTKADEKAAAGPAMARVGDVLNGRRPPDPEETVPWMPAPAEVKP